MDANLARPQSLWSLFQNVFGIYPLPGNEFLLESLNPCIKYNSWLTKLNLNILQLKYDCINTKVPSPSKYSKDFYVLFYSRNRIRNTSVPKHLSLLSQCKFYKQETVPKLPNYSACKQKTLYCTLYQELPKCFFIFVQWIGCQLVI